MWLVLCRHVLDTHPGGHGGRRGGCYLFCCHDTRQCFHNTTFPLSGQASLDRLPCMMLVRLERDQGPLGIAILIFVCESLTAARARHVHKRRLKSERGWSRRKTRSCLEGIKWTHCLCFPFLCRASWVFQLQGFACPWDPGSCREQSEKTKSEGGQWANDQGDMQWWTSAASRF